MADVDHNVRSKVAVVLFVQKTRENLSCPCALFTYIDMDLVILSAIPYSRCPSKQLYGFLLSTRTNSFGKARLPLHVPESSSAASMCSVSIYIYLLLMRSHS